MSEHDLDANRDRLYLSHPLQDPLVRRVLQSVGLPGGSRGLDAGCGVGLQIPLLAEAVGPRGHVTALDILPQFVAEAAGNVVDWGLAGHASLVQGNVFAIPFADRGLDWIWSSNCACYSMRRPLDLLTEFRRVLKPGGQLLILIWSGQQLLPGYPRLEALLNATAAGIAPFAREDRPEHHFLRLLCWLGKAGFVDLSAQPFSEGVCAPLEDPIRRALLALFEMRWTGAEKELSPADRRLYRRITDPASPEFILDLPGYYGFYTYTLFRATAPE